MFAIVKPQGFFGCRRDMDLETTVSSEKTGRVEVAPLPMDVKEKDSNNQKNL